MMDLAFMDWCALCARETTVADLREGICPICRKSMQDTKQGILFTKTYLHINLMSLVMLVRNGWANVKLDHISDEDLDRLARGAGVELQDRERRRKEAQG